MISWRPKNVEEVSAWKLAMVLSKGNERILIGSQYNISQVLSGKEADGLHYDESRAVGSFLIGFDDDRLAGKWKTALRYLLDAQELILSKNLLRVFESESSVIEQEKKAQSILQDKYDTGDPVCQYVAIRIWYGYWSIREKEDRNCTNTFFSCMENLIRPFYRESIMLREDRKVLPEDPIFRWPAVLMDCDARMITYNPRLKGTEGYIVADDSLIPLKQYYTDNLHKWKVCIVQCKMCGKYFIGRSLHRKYCGESCRKAAQIMRKETRMEKKVNKDVEQLCRNEYAYWYNRIRKAKASTEWTESDVYDLESAFIIFKENKVLMRQKYKSNEITFWELHSWFLRQRDIVDAIMNKNGRLGIDLPLLKSVDLHF